MNPRIADELEEAIDRALQAGDLETAESLARRYREQAASAPADGSVSLAFRANYLAAQVSLAAGQLRQTVQRLAALQPLPSGLPLALACRVWLLGSEALARLRRFPEANGHLRRALTTGAIDRDPLLRLRQLRVRLWLGEVASLGRDLDSCREELDQRGDIANQTLLLCEEGRAWDTLGEMNRAEGCWDRAEVLSRALGRDLLRADVLAQRARLAHLRGHLQQALDGYEAALDCAPALPQRAEVLLRQALVFLDLNQHGRAREAFEAFAEATGGRALAQLPEEVRGLAGMAASLLGLDTSEIGDIEFQAHRRAQEGDLEEARRLYREAHDLAAGPVRRARLALAVGMLALAVGDPAEAERWLRRAEEAGESQGLPEVHWRALQARGQQAAEAGDEEQARALLEQAVLISEGQLRRLRHRADAAAHHLRRAGVLRLLLRAACRRGDGGAALRYQELERGRLLLELWQGVPDTPTARLEEGEEWRALEQNLARCQQRIEQEGEEADGNLWRRREELLLERDRLLDRHLRDTSRRDGAALPALAELGELNTVLPEGGVYAAPALCDDDLYLLTTRRGGPGRVIPIPGSANRLLYDAQVFRQTVEAQLERYRRGLPLCRRERAELDGLLERMGQGSLGEALHALLGDGDRLVWVPDGGLHGLPVHALRRGGRYLVEDHEVVFGFGGSLLVHQLRRRWPRRLFGRALVVAEAPEVLPAASAEGRGVAGAFPLRRLLGGNEASREAVRRGLSSARVAHFACHAFFDARHPLAACIALPSGESWRALDWVGEPFDGLPLAVLSACRSAEVAPLLGREVFGLVTGLLAAGVRAVIAELWPMADAETLPIVWDFYRERLLHGLAGGLAQAQRRALSRPEGSPLFWAPFALFGDPTALPPPPQWMRWLAHWRQRRHARRFPIPSLDRNSGAPHVPRPEPAEPLASSGGR